VIVSGMRVTITAASATPKAMQAAKFERHPKAW
jgi:hypothetical protein